MEVILVYVKDYDVDGEWRPWNIYSEYTSNKAIEKEFKEAQANREIGPDAEFSTER